MRCRDHPLGQAVLARFFWVWSNVDKGEALPGIRDARQLWALEAQGGCGRTVLIVPHFVPMQVKVDNVIKARALGLQFSVELGSQATIITTAVCGSFAAGVNAGVAVLAGGACGSVCAPAGPAAAACAAFCARAAGGLSAVAVGAACAELRSAICDPLTQRCANCNSANNGICDAGSTQCCAGETGTQCGAGCCCCPECQAPAGINCACTAAPC